MKSMKGFTNMLGSVRRRPSAQDGTSESSSVAGSQLDTPEANAARSVRLFCESGGPNNSGEEVLHLPTIVEAAESSPAAAKECAHVIRKFLSKDTFARPHVQYNGIMLVRILADNPGPTFTRNIDKKFVDTVKELLRVGRDPSVKQILIETLDSFEKEKKLDEHLGPLIQMWEKEQAKMSKIYGPKVVAPQVLNTPAFDNQNYFSRSHSTNRPLPAPHELSSRIEEARTSAKLLTQLVQSTPPTEIFQNELIREFADRCLSASRSIQGYIVSQNPPPDNDTMLTLIETNEQLALAMSKHQRAVLTSRKALGLNSEGPSPGPSSPDPTAGIAPPPGPPPNSKPKMPARKPAPALAPSSKQEPQSQPAAGNVSPTISLPDESEDPFKDPATKAKTLPPFPTDNDPITDQFFDRLGVEPYHPGFNPTLSYTIRQDNAVGNVAMHTAASSAPEGQQVEKEVVQPQTATDEDSYDVSPVQRKAPIYRY